MNILEYQGHKTTDMYHYNAYSDYKKRKFLVNDENMNIRDKKLENDLKETQR